MKKSNSIILISILLIVDLLIKYFVSSYLENITIIDNFFSLNYVLNDGAAFSIFASKTYFLIIITIVCFAFLIYELINNLNDKVKALGYSLALSGLLGNFIDRLVDGYVIDYLSFKIFNYSFPIFNFADILIVVGILIVLFKEIRGEFYENRSK